MILPFKTCACGLAYAREDWEALPRCGYMDDEEEVLEIRNCACGSSIAVVVDVSVSARVRDGMTLTEAYRALGLGHRKALPRAGAKAYAHDVYVVATGEVIATLTANEGWQWLLEGKGAYR